MTKLSITVATAALAVAPAFAQEDHFTSSPQGYEGVEGGTSVDLIGKEALLRFQQIDAWTFGSKTNRVKVFFRRDGLLATNPAYGSRNVELEMVMGEGNLTTATSDFATNYNTGTDVVVINRKFVNFKDWTIAPAIPPQAEAQATELALDTPFNYAGKTATGTDLVWEVRVFSNDKAGSSYPMDADLVMPTTVVGTGSSVAAGCFGASHTNVVNFGTHYRLDMDVSGAAGMSPAYMVLGNMAVQTPVFGLCAPFETNPVYLHSMGNTDVTGFVASSINNISQGPMDVGMPVYGQAFVLDFAFPSGVAMGQTRVAIVPVNPPLTPQAVHHWALDPTATNSTSGLQTGGIILHTNHP